MMNFSWAKGRLRQMQEMFLDDLRAPDYSLVTVLQLLVILIVGTLACQVIYNLYFHPLAHYPGPLLARASVLWRFYHSLTGRFHRVIALKHKQYGDVFRVGPDEVSFVTPSALQTIYGNRTAEEPNSPAPKNEWYDMLAAGFGERCLVSERQFDKAGEKRALFSHAFTHRSLLKQEQVMQRCIDGFVAKVGRLGSGPAGVDLVKWYEMISFDIFGELAFGESFNCIDSEKPHYWLEMILDHLLVVQIMDNLRRFPLLVAIARSLPAKWTVGLARKQTQYSRDKTKERLSRGVDQDDFMTRVVGKVEAGLVPEEEMVAHASTLVMAGGETTSTSMAAITFHLLKTPEAMRRLQREIRTRFKTADDIDITSTAQISYLQACLKEGMRLYTAGPQGLPRKSPGMTVDGHYVPQGVELYVSRWAAAHDDRYFADPMAYKPERWIDPDSKDTKEASQPFSLGPRVCIGRSFAYAQMSLELSKLIWSWDMELVNPDLDFEEESRMYFQWRKPKMFIRFRPTTNTT